MYHKKKKMPMGMGGNMPTVRKKQVPSHAGEQLLGAKVLGGAVGGGLKSLAGQLFDGKKGVDFGQVGKAALGGAAGQVPFVGKGLQQAITGGGAQGQAAMPGSTAPGLPGQQQPGQGLFGMIQQAQGGMVDYSNGGPTPEQLAEASQILANMGKEEKLAKYGMMSDEAILQEIARGLDGGGAAPTPNRPESQAGDRAYFEDKVQHGDSPLPIRTQSEIDRLEAAKDRAREEAITEGGSRSAAQALYDELSQIGAGLAAGSGALDRHSQRGIYTPDHVYAPGSAGYLDAVRRGYNRKEQEVRDRMESGAKGTLDARNPFSMAYDFAVGSETTGLNSATFKPGRGMEFVRDGIARRESPVRQFAGGRVKLRKRY